MSRSIFIQNTAGLAASAPATNNPDDVADGKVVLLGIDGEGAVGLDDGAGVAPDRFMVVRGVSNGNARRSHIIKKADILDVTFEGYAAPTAQVTTITPTAGSTAAGRATLKITRIDQGFEQYPRATYEIEVASGDTPTQIVTKLKNAITAAKSVASPVNGITKHVVTASGTATLVLTAIEIEDEGLQGTPRKEQVSFATGLDGEATGGWTIASTTAPTRGSGTYDQVNEYEQKSFGNFGFYYTEHYPQRPEGHALAGTEYDLVTLRVKNDADRAVNRSFEEHEVVIAVLAGELTPDTVLGLFGFSHSSPSP